MTGSAAFGRMHGKICTREIGAYSTLGKDHPR
jgi:hypothetical protein